MTVSVAIHWFDQDRFLAEAHRVLRQGHWLMIYQNGFSGRMIENPAYEKWNREHYVVRYPTPPRNGRPLSDDLIRANGFQPGGSESYTNDVIFTPPQLVAYLLTQSNVIAAVEQGREPIEDVARWITQEVSPFFSERAATFPFGGSIRYLRRN